MHFLGRIRNGVGSWSQRSTSCPSHRSKMNLPLEVEAEVHRHPSHEPSVLGRLVEHLAPGETSPELRGFPGVVLQLQAPEFVHEQVAL